MSAQHTFMTNKLAYVALVVSLGCGGPIESTSDASTPPCPEVVDGGSACEMRTFYQDKDGDGFGTWHDAPESRCLEEGIRLGLSLNNEDCADYDADANPLASAFRRDEVNGSSSSTRFDWNCDAREEPKLAGQPCSVGGCR